MSNVHDGGRRDALDVLSMWRGRSNTHRWQLNGRVATQPHFSLPGRACRLMAHVSESCRHVDCWTDAVTREATVLEMPKEGLDMLCRSESRERMTLLHERSRRPCALRALIEQSNIPHTLSTPQTVEASQHFPLLPFGTQKGSFDGLVRGLLTQ
jgi:hypothetical protein